MHVPISAVFSLLFFLPLTFFLLFLSSFSLSLLLVSCHGSFPLPSMATAPFYSGLISWDFSLLALGLHQLFLVCYGHPFRTTNLLVARSLLGKPSAFSFFYYPFHDKISICLILLQASPSLPEWIRTWVSHYLPLWHASGGLSRLLPLLGKMSSQQGIFPKNAMVGNPK